MGKGREMTDAEFDKWTAQATEMGGVPTFLYVEQGLPEGAQRFVVNGFALPGYVVGDCQHKVAQTEWVAGMRECERCPKAVHQISTEDNACCGAAGDDLLLGHATEVTCWHCKRGAENGVRGWQAASGY